MTVTYQTSFLFIMFYTSAVCPQRSGPATDCRCFSNKVQLCPNQVKYCPAASHKSIFASDTVTLCDLTLSRCIFFSLELISSLYWLFFWPFCDVYWLKLPNKHIHVKYFKSDLVNMSQKCTDADEGSFWVLPNFILTFKHRQAHTVPLKNKWSVWKNK